MAPPDAYGPSFSPDGASQELQDLFAGIAARMAKAAQLDPGAEPPPPDGFAAASARIAEIGRRYAEPYRLGVVGEFNAGKSTLINMLLGRPGTVMEGVVATTGVLTELWWGESASGEVLDEQGAPLFQGSLEEARRYTDQRTEEGRSVHGRRVRVILRLPADRLRNLVVLDTPGLSATETDDTTTEEALHLVDAAVLVVSGLKPGDDRAVRLAERLRRTGRRFVVAVTKKNRITDMAEALTAVMDGFGFAADGEPVPLDSVDALAALKELRAALEGGQPEAVLAAQEHLADTGYPALHERLSASFFAGPAGSDRGRRALSDVSDTLRRLGARAQREAKRLTAAAAEAEGERTEHETFVETTLTDRRRRLDRKLSDVVDLHVAELLDHVAEAAELAIEEVDGRARRLAVRGMWQGVTTFFTGKEGPTLQQQMHDAILDALGPTRLRVFSATLHRAALDELSYGWKQGELTLPESGEDLTATLVPLIGQVTTGAKGIVDEAGDQLTASVTRMFSEAGVIYSSFSMLLSDLGIGAAAQRRRDRLSLAKRRAAVGVHSTRAGLAFDQRTYYLDANLKVFERLKEETLRKAGVSEQESGRLRTLAGRWEDAARQCGELADRCDGLAGGGAPSAAGTAG
ncbi:dynamin family protein [Streptomyces sp. NPDC021224]|uniref:dynamin family protein n=1 Tax=unclassified Streptomyces TaxID=2593676 RepID=UPI0037B9A1F3